MDPTSSRTVLANIPSQCNTAVETELEVDKVKTLHLFRLTIQIILITTEQLHLHETHSDHVHNPLEFLPTDDDERMKPMMPEFVPIGGKLDRSRSTWRSLQARDEAGNRLQQQD